MSTATISGNLFKEMIRGGAANLSENRKIVNDLNVFPIPDGDTGDNMFMTIDSGAMNLATLETDDLDEIASAAASGMLKGARGNSGVILSRIFAGIAKGFVGLKTSNVYDLGKALEKGIEESYSAVKVPVEGTILTVNRDAVNFANSRISQNSTFESYFEDFCTELRNSLDRTPELLAVLKEAGVVDSGGAGFVYIVEGMKNALSGKILEYSHGDLQKASINLDNFTADSVLTFGYCTEFLLRLQNAKVDVENFDENALSTWLDSVGDSVVCFKDGSIIKVHVHTKNPGEILNYCQNFGEFLTLKIENMTLQHSEVNIENRFSEKESIKVKKPHKKYAIVSVAAGAGIKNTFLELGCDAVVDGGQSMNPSAQDLIDAFSEINADNILVFPNNSNIILTANQAAEIYKDSNIVVIPSKTIGEGYAAISMLDTTSDDIEEIKAGLSEIMEGVVTGFVSRASRDAVMDGVNVKRDDFVGFSDGVMYTDNNDPNSAALLLSEKLDMKSYDIALVVYGSEISDETAEELVAELQKNNKMTEIISIKGDQPVYEYVIVLE